MKNYFNDFVLIFSKSVDYNFEEKYSRKIVKNGYSLFLDFTSAFSLFNLEDESNSPVLNINQSFVSLFNFETKNLIMITTNFENILVLKESLSINEKAIKEFVLFNTPLGENTFFKEVKRLFNLKSITINDTGLNFAKYAETQDNKTVYENFSDKIQKHVGNLRKCKNGIFLSGGYESRINAAISHYYDLDRKFYTWGNPKDKEFKIANKIVNHTKGKHFNIRPDASNLPYQEYLEKTGYLSNMQYAYRYQVVHIISEEFDIDVLWTGWGDINGYPNINQPSEFLSTFFLNFVRGKIKYTNGWSHDWLHELNLDNYNWMKPKKNRSIRKKIHDIKYRILAPFIFGQVLTIENTLIPIYAPWFDFDIYNAVANEEVLNCGLAGNKMNRTYWKGSLYYNILKKYDNQLNYIKNSKGFYPFFLKKNISRIGIGIATVFKQIEKKRKYPFDPVEDKDFLKGELIKIVDHKFDIFDNKSIHQIISNKNWTGNQILEIFKLIQIHWLLKKILN